MSSRMMTEGEADARRRRERWSVVVLVLVLVVDLIFVLIGRSSPASRVHVAPFRRASASRPRVTGVAAKIADLVVIFLEERCIFFRVGEEARSKMWRQLPQQRV